MTIGERIKNRRKQLGMTADDLAEKSGKSRATIYRYENGDIESLPANILLDLANALFTTPADLMGYPTNVSSNYTIPILGRVVAGYPVVSYGFKEDELEVSKAMYESGEYFGLRIHGDSMSPAILDGDIVIVKQQPDAESGEIVIATVNGDEATCKRLRKYKDGIELIPNNPSYEPLEFSKKEIAEKPVQIIGKVVELRRKF